MPITRSSIQHRGRQWVNEIHRQTDRETERQRGVNLNCFKRVTHHSNQHVDEDDDRWDVIQSEQKHSDWVFHVIIIIIIINRNIPTVSTTLVAWFPLGNTWAYRLSRSLLGYLISTLSTPISPNIDQNRLNSVRDNLSHVASYQLILLLRFITLQPSYYKYAPHTAVYICSSDTSRLRVVDLSVYRVPEHITVARCRVPELWYVDEASLSLVRP